jgi:hypothetical protein
MDYKKFFVSFSNEKYLGGLNRIENQVKLLNVFDNIFTFTDKDLEKIPEFWSRHGEFVNNNPRGHGYWIWKPFLILKTLEKMKYGDILFYADAGCEINYEGIEKLEEFFNTVKTNGKGLLSFQLNDFMFHHEGRWSKMDLINHFNAECYRLSLQIHATYFFLEKNSYVMNLINLWYDTACNYHFIDDSPSVSKNDDYFIEHRHDQSIFSLIRKVNETQYIFTPNDLKEAKYPIFDVRNKNFTSEIYQKKVVIQTWTQKVKNLQQTNEHNFWGLGDIIRGTIKLFQLSKKMNFDLIVDIQHHPISKFFKCTNTKYKDLVKKHANNINFVFPGNVESYIEQSNHDIIILITNDSCDDNSIDNECKEFIKNIFTPNDFLREYISIKLDEVDIERDRYNILHFRLGDEELVRKNMINVDNEIVEKLNKAKENNDVLLSDSEYFKKYVKENTHIKMYNTKIAHLGYQTHPSEMMDTLFEFFLLMNAKKIKTYSVYTWISGFVFWVHKIYDVPLEKI